MSIFSRRQLLAIGGVVLTESIWGTQNTIAKEDAPRGDFLTNLDTRFLDNGRDVEILTPFVYQDPKNRIWTVPKGSVVNGSSIPPRLWGILRQSPFVGLHRYASVIHDFYCKTEEYPWRITHRVYFDACITAGMDRRLAAAFYYAVYLGGPRWAASLESNAIVREGISEIPPAITNQKELLSKTDGLSIEEIEQLANADRLI